MIRSQVITLNVIYDDEGGTKRPPEEWRWDAVVRHTTSLGRSAVEVLAAGPVKPHPLAGNRRSSQG